MTYGELADILGFKSARGMGTFLEYIMCYCENNRLPPLTVIVVNKETGLPGAGLTLDDLHAERERVFSFDWFGLVPPTPQELMEAVNEAP
jgi:putative restriction endonuclease